MKHKSPILYKSDGTIKEVYPRNRKNFTLAELQEIVEGLIQIVPMPSGKLMIVNEEARVNNLPVNQKAIERVWQVEYPISRFPINNDELILGNVVVCDPSYVDK